MLEKIIHWAKQKMGQTSTQMFHPTLPIEDLPIVCIDLEMTGLNPNKDVILSMAGIPVKGKEMLLHECLDLAIRQDYYQKESILIHEITPQSSSKEALTECEAITSFHERFSGSLWLGYFAELDYTFLRKAAQNCHLTDFEHPMLDIFKILSRFSEQGADMSQHTPKEWQLENVLASRGLSHDNPHSAIGDAYATALLWFSLFPELKSRGIRTWKDLHRFLL